ITAFLDSINWNGFGISAEIWTFIMLIVAAAVAGLMAYYRQDIAYLLVLIWAFIGIGVEQSDTPQVANAAYLAAAIVAIFVIIVIIQKFRQTRKPEMATS
ncbi:MAG: tryptophan-rich sensory protein, partial [Chloroflexota bacterium]